MSRAGDSLQCARSYISKTAAEYRGLDRSKRRIIRVASDVDTCRAAAAHDESAQCPWRMGSSAAGSITSAAGGPASLRHGRAGVEGSRERTALFVNAGQRVATDCSAFSSSR